MGVDKPDRVSVARDRWVLSRPILLVSRKLVKLATATIGKMVVSDRTLEMTVVLMGVLVMATFTAAMQHRTAMVG